MTHSLQNHSESREGFVLRTLMTKIAFTVHAAAALGLLIAVGDLAAAPRPAMPRPARATMTPPTAKPSGPAMGTPKASGMGTAPDARANVDPPSPDDVLSPDDHVYRPVVLETRKIVWFEPAQRGLIQAHPLVMGLAAMALATVTLLFFFLRGIKRPKDGDL